MSVEGQRYVSVDPNKFCFAKFARVEKIVVKKDQLHSRTEGYKNWGMTTNKKLSTAGNWRK